MAEKLVDWTPRTSVANVGRELDRVYNKAVTTDLANGTIGSSSGASVFTINSNDNASFIRAQGFSSAANTGSTFEWVRTGGTSSSPSALLTGWAMGKLLTRGYTGSNYILGPRIEIKTTENWNTSNTGSSIEFHAIENGTNSSVVNLTCYGDRVETPVPLVDLTETFWLEGRLMSNLDGNAGSTSTGTVEFVSLPDSLTTTLTYWFNCPEGWQGKTVETHIYYRGQAGLNNYRVNSSVSSKAPTDNFTRTGTIDVASVSEAASADTIRKFNVSTTHNVVSDAELLFVEVQREGGNAGDTATSSLEIVGIRLSLV